MHCYVSVPKRNVFSLFPKVVGNISVDHRQTIPDNGTMIGESAVSKICEILLRYRLRYMERIITFHVQILLYVSLVGYTCMVGSVGIFAILLVWL